MRKVALWFIRGYKKFINPFIRNRCRYFPSCSAYAYQSVIKYGALVGSIIAAWRLIRCNPFSKGGYDPVRENIRGESKWLL